MPKPEQTVGAFLETLEHAHKDAILAARAVILSADPAITESVKWNAPSFATSEHFATFHLRHKTGIQVVLHLGAKPRPDATVRSEVSDPAGLLDWRSPDRAVAVFHDAADVAEKAAAFATVIREWIKHVR
ncbi:MAG: DUF1801 domain-containing protein [Gemmatimonadetes bacterium]|nr:DUF1801 domain-containing protein [Gemmatimonadota bacterium]